MGDRQDPIEYLLLDYKLDRLDEAARREVEAQAARNPALATKLDRLTAVLEPLDTWAAPRPPGNLVSEILDRIEGQAYPRLSPASGLPPGERRGPARRPRISLRELVALAACILFFVGVFVPSVSRARFLSRRTMCKTNLASIFGGMSAYATDSGGFLPNAGMQRGADWLRRSPNRRNFGILVRLKYVPGAGVFVCPSRSDHRPMEDSTASGRESFPGTRHCSYDLQNMAGPTKTMTRRICLPIVSDANPLFEGGRFHAHLDPQRANSRSHRGRGQNVLCLDGRVIFAASPIVGTYGDNIWTARNVRVYVGTEVQQAATDAFLVP